MDRQALYKEIILKNPGLNEIEKGLLTALLRLLEHLEDTEVNREFLRYSSEARLLANTLGLLSKQSFQDEKSDLASDIQRHLTNEP